MLNNLLNAKWYSLVGLAGGVLFFHSFISKEVFFDRSGTAFLGAAMVFFACARNECMKTASRLVDASEMPSGVGSGIISGPVHVVTIFGGMLYLLSILGFIIATIKLFL